MAVPTWTVAQLCAAVGDVIDRAFADELWVRGRIKGLRRSQPGHLYFDLTEHGEDGPVVWDAPKIAVVAFRGRLRGIEAVLAKVGNLSLSDDLDVRIRGRVEYYAPQGRVQFTMNAIDPRHTLGQIAVDRDRVLKALAADGLLDRNGQLSLPPVPLRIGLVTSDGSAAFEDFCHELAATPFAFPRDPGRRTGPRDRRRGLAPDCTGGGGPRAAGRDLHRAGWWCPHRPAGLRQ